MRPYVLWALIGMVGYSLTTLFVKLAVRGGHVTGFFVLALATSMVALSSIAIAALRGDFATATPGPAQWLWVVATGIALAVAVSSLFRALSIGPATVVVPLYGMFIVGGALLSVIFLHEPLTVRKVAGLGAAVVAAYLVST